MAGFLDFISSIDDFVPGGAKAIPSWLTGLLVKKPANTDVSAALPYYQMIAEQSAKANAFADEQAQFYDENYRPAAVNFNQRANAVGGTADLQEASARGGANFNAAYGTAKARQTQTMADVNPNSGAAMARRGALEASYAPGLVDAMNRARFGREQYGDSLRATAIPMLATTPNYGTGMSGAATAAAGTAANARMQNEMYRQEAADTTKALKLPFDYEDERQRSAKNKRSVDDILGRIDAWSRSRTPGYVPDYIPNAGSMWANASPGEY